MIVSVLATSSRTVLMIEEHEANSQRTQEEGQYTKAAQWNSLGCLIDPWHALTGACVFQTTKECPNSTISISLHGQTLECHLYRLALQMYDDSPI